MFFKSIVAALLCIFLAFMMLEVFWLGWFSPPVYQTEMQGLLRQEFITWPWVAFYLIYGAVVFVLTVVANRDKPWFYASIDGALLGLAAYGTYNLTNYSILEGFTLKIMFIDWGWGTFLSSACATAGWLGFQNARSTLRD